MWFGRRTTDVGVGDPHGGEDRWYAAAAPANTSGTPDAPILRLQCLAPH